MKGLIAAATAAGALAIGGTYVLAPTTAGDSADTTTHHAELSGLDRGLGPAPWPDGKAYWHAGDQPSNGGGDHHSARVAGVQRFATMGLWADCVERHWSRTMRADKSNLERACGPRPTPETRRG
ncbi:MAG: hypothetical protein ACTHKG_16745 [Nocardioides sp.]